MKKWKNGKGTLKAKKIIHLFLIIPIFLIIYFFTSTLLIGVINKNNAIDNNVIDSLVADNITVSDNYWHHNDGKAVSSLDSLSGCNNYAPETTKCYHIRTWEVNVKIGEGELERKGEGGTIHIDFDADEMADGQPWEYDYYNYHDGWIDDVRFFKYQTTNEECPESSLNGKWARGSCYRWMRKGESEPEECNHGKDGDVMDIEWNLFLHNQVSPGYRANNECSEYGYYGPDHPDGPHACEAGLYYLERAHDLTKYKCQGHPKTYSVVYNGNGATSGSTETSNYEYDVSQQLTANGFKREYNVTFNYNDNVSANTVQTAESTFNGWATSPDGGVVYGNQETVINLDTNDQRIANLYANWTPRGISLPQATRIGYNFLGWYTAASGGTRIGGAGDSYTPTENTMLYAQWQLRTVDKQGTVTWNDQNNKYSARPSQVNVDLYRDGTKIQTTQLDKGSYTFSNLQEYNVTTGQLYNYTVNQNEIDAYETIIDGYNITNNLILPDFISDITYTPKDTYQGQYLKNGKVVINAQVQARENSTYQELGLNNGVVTFAIDSAIELDKSTLKMAYTNVAGAKTNFTSYSINENTITIDFGKNKESRVGEKLEIEVLGTLKDIKTYSSSINLTGRLRSIRGTNTSINLGELTRTEKGFTVVNQMPKANFRLGNIDSITEEKLTDAIFILYEWNGIEYIQKEVLTDSNEDGIYESNYYEWNPITQGKYMVKETGIPENHKDLNFSMKYNINQLKTEDYTIYPDYSNQDYEITYEEREPDDFDRTFGIVENEPYKLKVTIRNIDRETKNEIQNQANFRVYEWNKDLEEYKEYLSYTRDGEVLIERQADGTYVVGEWLYYTERNEGKYKIVQDLAPKGYYGDYDENGNKREYDVNVKEMISGGTVENEGTIVIENNNKGELDNKRVEGEIYLQLVDAETKQNKGQSLGNLEGATFGIYAKEIIYYPDGITTNYEGEGAVLYKENELVATLTTDEEAKAMIQNLYCGKYYIKQITTSDGYTKDENAHDIDLSYQREDQEKIIVNITIENKIRKQSFEIIKIQSQDDNIYNPLEYAGFTIYEIKELSIVKYGKIEKQEDGNYEIKDIGLKEALNGKETKKGTYRIQDIIEAYYKIIYTEEDMEKLPQTDTGYRPYNMEGESYVKNYAESSEGQDIEEMMTDSKGYLKSPELAYGEYIVIETNVPKEKSVIKPFVITIEKDSRIAQSLRYVLDENFTTRVKIYNKDMETKEDILKEGAQFVIENIETGRLETERVWTQNGYAEIGTYENPYITSGEGYLITPMELGVGKYRIIQIEAVEGYVRNGYEGYAKNYEIIMDTQPEVEFEISTDKVYYTDSYLEEIVIIEEVENKAQVGTLEINLIGEKLKGIDKNNNFIYEKQPIEGAIIGIYAREDIYTQDNQGTIKYVKDQLVGQIETNVQGIGYIDNIPIGKYYLKEIKASEGFALNKKETDITIEYGTNEVELEKGTEEWQEKAEITPVLKFKLSNSVGDDSGKHIGDALEDIRQKIQINVLAKEQESNEQLEGIVLGIYSKEDIIADGKVIVKRNTLIERKVTNAQGKITFETDLPLGDYYVKEIESIPGCMPNKTIYYMEGTYKEDQREVIIFNIDHIIETTKVSIEKVDEQYRRLEGAKLEIIDEQGQKKASWISSSKVQPIVKLELNQTYFIQEIETVPGYVTIDPIKFIIEEDGSIKTEAERKGNNILVMNYTTKLEIEVVYEDTDDIKETNFEIYKVNEDGTEEKIGEIKVDEENNYIEKLPVGEYRVKSKDTPYGYKPVDTTITIEDTRELQKIRIDIKKAEFDIEVEEYIKEIRRNGQVEYANNEDEKQINKIEIKSKKVKTEDIQITYKIRVKNISRIAGKVGRLEVSIPEGMMYKAEDNDIYWKVENGKVVTEALAEIDMQEGDYIDAELVLRWKNGEENLGTKETVAEIKDVTNELGYAEKREDNNKASIGVIISVQTGEPTEQKGVIYFCFTMLGVLIVLEMIMIQKIRLI